MLALVILIIADSETILLKNKTIKKIKSGTIKCKMARWLRKIEIPSRKPIEVETALPPLKLANKG